MAAYVYYLDKLTAQIKGYTQASTYDIGRDVNFTEKSKIVVPERPEINNDDIVVLRDDTSMVFCGVCDEITTGKAPYTLTLRQMENLFDRTIFAGNEALIESTGMEDFIVSEIKTNFISSGDSMIDKPYISVSAKTHTKITVTVSSIVDADHGIYNLRTFLGNVLEKYGIRLIFTISNGRVVIEVRKISDPTLYLDTTFSDIVDLEETYKVDVLAKLNVKWGIPDDSDSYVDEDNETLYVGNEIADIVYLTFYLQQDRTITTNKDSATRVDGTVKNIYIETEDEDDVIEQVMNEFISNSYEHSMTFYMSKESKVYPPGDIYIGRSVSIRSKHTGLITSSIVTKVLEKDKDLMRTITIGKLPITLIEKIRRL